MFLVEFSNFNKRFFYKNKKRSENKNVINVKNTARIKKRKNVFYIYAKNRKFFLPPLT